MTVTVRAEAPGDFDGIDEVHRRAFGREHEVRLIRALRESAEFVPELALVALDESDAVVGHTVFTPISIVGAAGSHVALVLSPMAVHPDAQRTGVGTELALRGLETCRSLDHRAVLVLGDPRYYRRFGFVTAQQYGISSPYAGPAHNFMALELAPGALDGVRGRAEFPEPFRNV